MTPEQAFEEKRVAYSRENERGGICDCCREDPEDCGRTPFCCMEDGQGDWGERDHENRREMEP